MRLFLLILALTLNPAIFSYPPLPEPRTEEEGLFVRRIIDFWRDREYPFAQTQIETYLKKFPDTPFADHFYAMQGDIALHGKNYPEALNSYEKIKGKEMQRYVESKRWLALYHLQSYTQLYEELSPKACASEPESEALPDQHKFYFAESAFREGLTLERYPEASQEAKHLYLEALTFYRPLLKNDSFGSHAKLATAEIYRLLGEHDESSKLYSEIANDSKNAEILLHASTVLVDKDREKSLRLLKALTQEGSQKSAQAAFQWLTLLAQDGNWTEIEQERRLLLAQLSPTNLPLAYFYLGMIAYEKKAYYQAVLDLTKSDLKEPKALLALAKSAKEIDRLDICLDTHQLIKKNCPQNLPDSLLLISQAFRKNKEPEKALATLEELLQTFPNSSLVEIALREKIALLTEQRSFKEAHEEALAFLKQFPTSPRKVEMMRLLVDLSLSQVAQEKIYEQLANDLENGLKNHAFQDHEIAVKETLLAKAYLKLNRSEAALSLLERMENPDPLLMLDAYVQQKMPPEKIIALGEKILQSDRNPKVVHLYLFNAYLEASKEHPGESLTDKAAEHLSLIIDTYPISLENRIWLGRTLAQQDNPQGTLLLESLLQTDQNFKRFDEEALILAKQLQKKGHLTEARTILERVINLKQPTKLKAELYLAQLMQEQGETAQALSIYRKLEGCAELPIAYQAGLEHARAKMQTDPLASLKKFNELKIRKVFANEPLHLEAAIDWVFLSANLVPANEKDKTSLKLLQQVKDEFTAQNDIWSKEYQSHRSRHPEKEKIYQAYMRYIDASIYQLQAQLSLDLQDTQLKIQAARALFSTLKQGKYAVSTYLIEKATQGLKDLENHE